MALVRISTPAASGEVHPRGGRSPARGGPGADRAVRTRCARTKRGTPPGSSSRSTATSTRARARSVRWPRPARRDRRRPPAHRRPGRVRLIALPLRQRARDGRAAEEALTASVGGPGAPADATEVHRRDRRRQCVPDLTLGHPLAEAHDVAVGRIVLHLLGVIEGPRADSPSSGIAGITGSWSASVSARPASPSARRRIRRWRATPSSRWNGSRPRRHSARVRGS